MESHPAEITQLFFGQALRALKGRTLLALIGIVIGTAAVIAMLHVGYNAKKGALLQFEKLGTDQVMIQPQADGNSVPDIKILDILGASSAKIGLIRELAEFDSFGFPERAESESLVRTGGVRCDQGFL